MGSLTRTSTTRSTTPWQPAEVETNVDQIDGVLLIGPDRTGRMLEVITVEDIDDGEVAIHAMK